MHRDIKLENILLDKYYNIKLCDFGWSIKKGTYNEICGTYEYLAPEILNHNAYDEWIDIWNIGIVLYMLAHKWLY